MGLKTGDEVGGRYRIERLLGRGGFGAVYLATHVTLGRKVALKVLMTLPDDDEETVERFLREGRATVALDHPGVPEVLDLGLIDDEIPYLAMEYLEGITLTELNARHPRVPPGVATAVILPILDVLEAAHAAGIVHRDLKPSNVMLMGGRRRGVKLLDFGIAKLIGESLTRPGVPIGTPRYMSPEQTVAAKDATAATDLYAVGVMLFELLSGRVPFEGETTLAVMAAVVKDEPPPLRSVAPAVDPELADLVDALLAKNPRARPSLVQVRERLMSAAPPDEAGLWALLGGPVSLAEQPVVRYRATNAAAAGSATARAWQPKKLAPVALAGVALIGGLTWLSFDSASEDDGKLRALQIARPLAPPANLAPRVDPPKVEPPKVEPAVAQVAPGEPAVDSGVLPPPEPETTGATGPTAQDLIDRGMSAYDERRWTDAVVLFERAIEQGGRAKIPVMMLGIIWTKLGQWSKGRTLLDEANDIYDTTPIPEELSAETSCSYALAIADTGDASSIKDHLDVCIQHAESIDQRLREIARHKRFARFRQTGQYQQFLTWARFLKSQKGKP